MPEERGDSSAPADRGAARGNGPPPWAEWLVARAGRVFMVGFGLFWLVGVGTIFAFVGWMIHDELREALVYRPTAAVITKYTPPKTEVDQFDEATTTPGLIEYAYTVAGTPHTGKYYQVRETNEYRRDFAGPQEVGR